MNSQKSSSLLLEERPGRVGVPQPALTIVTAMVVGLHQRYDVAVQRAGGRRTAYRALAALTGQMHAALSGPDPIGEMRALRAPTPAIQETVDRVVALLEGVQR